MGVGAGAGVGVEKASEPPERLPARPVGRALRVRDFTRLPLAGQGGRHCHGHDRWH